jgi:hypothetical protein
VTLPYRAHPRQAQDVGLKSTIFSSVDEATGRLLQRIEGQTHESCLLELI